MGSTGPNCSRERWSPTPLPVCTHTELNAAPFPGRSRHHDATFCTEEKHSCFAWRWVRSLAFIRERRYKIKHGKRTRSKRTVEEESKKLSKNRAVKSKWNTLRVWNAAQWRKSQHTSGKAQGCEECTHSLNAQCVYVPVFCSVNLHVCALL